MDKSGENIDWRILRARLEDPISCQDTVNTLRGLGETAWKELLDAATTDAKTELYTHHELVHDVEFLLKHPLETGLLIVTDLVHFKSEINDPHGQAYGDTIISLTATAFKKVISARRSDGLYGMRSEDTNGEGFRIGGDEYAALLRNGEALRSADHKAIVRMKLKGVLEDPELVTALEEKRTNGRRVNSFGIRAGAVLIDPALHDCFADVLKAADPKKETKCEYRLVRNITNTFKMVEIR